MKALILAGGLGTRLRETVTELPKSMAPVAGKPFLEYLLDMLVESEIHEVILSVGYRASIIQSHFGNRYKNLSLKYSTEESPLGTGGAIAHAVGQSECSNYLILNGDTFLGMNYAELLDWYSDIEGSTVMMLKAVPDISRYGSVIVDSDVVVDFVEKGKRGSGLINVGNYILSSEVFRHYQLPEKFSLETDLLQVYIRDLKPKAFVTDAYFIDIGIPEDYERAQIEMPKFLKET